MTTDTRPLRLIICGPPGVFTRVTRECWSCKVTGDQIVEHRGAWRGTDYHCLACRVTDTDGFEQQPTQETIARWDEVIADWLLPEDLFNEYVDAEWLGNSPEIDTVLKEQVANEAFRATRAKVEAYLNRDREVSP